MMSNRDLVRAVTKTGAHVTITRAAAVRDKLRILNESPVDINGRVLPTDYPARKAEQERDKAVVEVTEPKPARRTGAKEATE